MKNYSSTAFINKNILKSKAIAVPVNEMEQRSSSNPQVLVAEEVNLALGEKDMETTLSDRSKPNSRGLRNFS